MKDDEGGEDNIVELRSVAKTNPTAREEIDLNWDKFVEDAANLAKLQKMIYDSKVVAGFTEKQALELCRGGG